MPQAEIDDVAFLNGGSAKKQTLLVRNSSSMENVRPLVCSKGQTLCVTAIVLTVLVAISLIAAFARPFQHCNHLNGDDDDDDNDRGSPTAFPFASTPPLPPTAVSGEVFPWESIRLPDFIDPLHYSLFMHPNLTTFTNEGSVNITFRLLKDSDFIVLHSKDLEIESVEVSSPDDDDRDKDPEEIEILRYLLYPPHEQLYVEFKESLEVGINYMIEIEFSKVLEEKLEGFYISSYSTHDGDKRFLATTHFEATAARTAFPCFDEPSFKATFELDIVHSRYHNAYFNTPLIEEVEYKKTDLFVSSFETSVRMSTYLVAFVVCDFKSVEEMTKNDVKVRVLAPEEMLDQTKFALTTAVEVLDHFHEFFDIAYPLKKLDLIAVPDFGPGAMENWGLITFRTTAVLFNENESSITNEENIATIIAHELAHQWFGNLVTMEWWNDLWLNEGFASFVENLGTNLIKPDWKMMDQFTLVTTQDALALDSLESTHPILADVNNPTEIEAIFDAISYKKGSAIIQMLEEFLGLDTLKKGLTYYLNKYRFDNAETKDLWDAFTKVTPQSAHLDVAEIMNTWTQQKGFPLLTVKHSWRKLSIEQNRFLLTPHDNDNDSDDDGDDDDDDEADEDDVSPHGYKWYVPVTYITDEEPNDPELVWLNMTDGEFALDDAVDWVKVNVNQTGFYRVMYDKDNWGKLIKLLHENHKMLSPADRASLIDDAMVLAHVGILNSSVAFDLVDYLKEERDYVPWETALIHFDTLDSLLQESPIYPDYQEYILKLLTPLIELVGWEDVGSHLERKLRASVLATAVKYGHEDSIKKATELFEAWKDEGAHLSPNLRNVIYMAGVKHGDEEDWEFCWNKYLHSTVPSDKHLLLTALGNTDDIWQLSQYLDYSLDKDKVRPQDVTSVITVAARNPIGRLLTWRFVRSHWSQLLNMFGELSFSLDVIISESVSHFSTEFDYKEVKSFFASVQTGTGASSVKQSLERIRANIHWNEEIEDDLIAWLKKHVK